MEETMATKENIASSVISNQFTVCSHCKQRPANLTIKSFRPYCSFCWNEINAKKSASMRAKQMKRSVETRAAMSASKRVKKETDPKRWVVYRDFYLEQLQREDQLKQQVG